MNFLLELYPHDLLTPSLGNFNFINDLLGIGPQALTSCLLSLLINSHLGQLHITAFKLFQIKLVFQKMDFCFRHGSKKILKSIEAVIWMYLRWDLKVRKASFL